MIDSHCHLEQKDYDSDRDAVIEKCKAEGIKAVISSCAHPNDFNKGKEIVERYKNFVFLAAGIHPHYAKELTDKEIESAFNWLRDNANILSGIGEQGLDYSWAKEPKWREKQQKLFIKLIELAKELNKVIIVHARDSHSDVIRILEQQEAEVVQLHMWEENKFARQIIEHGWYVSIGPIVARSKKHRKVVRDIPIEQLMLETDSPWFGGKDVNGKPLRGDPTNIKIPAREIAKTKKIDVNDVWKICGKNAIRLFSLPIRI